MVYECRQVVRIPIIGIGGIMEARDAIEFIIAGASAVQVGTANFIDPFIWPKLLDGIRDYLRRHDIARVADPTRLTLSALGIFALLTLLVKNFWCRYLCPYGALLGILSRFSPTAVRRNDQPGFTGWKILNAINRPLQRCISGVFNANDPHRRVALYLKTSSPSSVPRAA